MKFVIQSDVLAKTLKALACAASRDGHRKHMSAVWIRATRHSQSWAYATDGHWAAVMRIDLDVETDGDIPIDITDVPRIVSVLPKRHSTTLPVTIARSGNAATISTPSFSMSTVVDPDLKPLSLEEVVPRGLSTRKHARVTYNTELLQKVAAAIQHVAPRSARTVGMRFYSMGEGVTSPSIVCSSQAPEFFAVVMPMRCSTKRYMDWWFEVADRLKEEKKAAAASAAPAEAAAE